MAAGGHQGSWAQSAGVAWEGLCPAKWYIFPEQGEGLWFSLPVVI